MSPEIIQICEGDLSVVLGVVGDGLTKSEQTHGLGLHTKSKQHLTISHPVQGFKGWLSAQDFQSS